MSDYGLLSRKLVLDVEYEDTPYTSAVAKVPVFAVGREQLYEMFGLFGRNKSTKPINFPVNYVCGTIGEYVQDARYVLVSFGRWADGTPSRMVTLSHSYDTFEQCFYSVACCIELDAWDLIRSHSGLIYDYEVWQICDDSELYGEWNVEVMAHVIQRSVYGVGVCDRKHKPNSNLFSEDYLISLKTANQVERCAACGEVLSKPYQFFIDGHGLVCHRCWQWYVHWEINVFDSQILADRLHRAALYDGFEDDPNFEDDGRSDDWWED